MKIPTLFLFLLPVAFSATEQTTEGTCSADGTCSATDKNAKTKVCFPDGECFGSMDEASSHYQNDGIAMELKVPKPYGESQQVKQPRFDQKTLETLANTHEYMTNLFQNETAKPFREQCRMTNDQCAYWASIGECEANPNYMKIQCAPACQTCEYITFEHRCPFDRNAPKVWGPGDVNKMFERLTTDDYYTEKYQPTVLSKPPEGPWVVMLENVTTEQQRQQLIKLGGDRGYQRSKDTGNVRFDGTFGSKIHDTRTSYNTWCLEECYEDEQTQTVLQNIENITGIPDQNSEYLQLLKYEETQHYGNHHDFIRWHHDRFQGVRLITVFLYLNDVEEGGGTHFGRLGLTVQPKAGRAVVWPSVLDEDPDERDDRTHHEALPVIKGVKYGANAWIHQRSFKEVFEKNCS